LSDHKRRALADGISCQPKNHQKVCTPDNTRASFIGPGLLDEGSKSAPDMLAILKTRRKTLLQEELDLVTENFVDLYNIMMRDGHIPEEKLSEMGFPSDCDMNNKEVERNAQISQEPYQRAKILSHETQRQYREKRLHDLHEAKISKIMVENHKRQKILDINQQCEEKLFKILGKDSSGTDHCTEKTLTDATLKDFSTHCKASELTAFCRARILPNESNSIIPKKKGKLGEALKGQENLILFAHRLRDRRPVLQVTEPPRLETICPAPEPVVCRFSLPAENLDLTIHGELSFLTEEWLAAALRTFFFTTHRISENSQKLSEIDDIKKSAKILYGHLRQRLEKHLRNRLDKQSSKINHWVWKWVSKNLLQLAALMVFVGHIQPEDVLSCSSENDCLLQHATDNEMTSMFWKVILENQDTCCNEEGSYLYYNRVRGIWVRSGKTTGKDRQIFVRHLEHREKAKLKELQDVSSKFYRSYPSRCATYSNSTRRGFFDQLDLYYGLAFDRKGSIGDLLTNKSPYSLLNWPTEYIERLKKWNLRGVGSDDIKEKQLHMASYLFELGYDLCLSPCDNVSQAPGFESIIGYQSNN
jgi:hypothetical protein